jgi:curved DNA-binding protein CbpA
VAEAYFERSRLFHPDLRHREDLSRFEKELGAVFDRMKKAYETLADREKRALYDQGLDAAPPSLLMRESAADPEMRKKLAAQNFRRARQLIEEKDYHPAVEMLREAVRFVPDNAEYRYVLSQEPELDRAGPGQSEGGGPSRRPARRPLGGSCPRPARSRPAAGSRALCAPRGFP